MESHTASTLKGKRNKKKCSQIINERYTDRGTVCRLQISVQADGKKNRKNDKQTEIRR